MGLGRCRRQIKNKKGNQGISLGLAMAVKRVTEDFEQRRTMTNDKCCLLRTFL
jgi:hypothetical protein